MVDERFTNFPSPVPGQTQRWSLEALRDFDPGSRLHRSAEPPVAPHHDNGGDAFSILALIGALIGGSLGFWVGLVLYSFSGLLGGGPSLAAGLITMILPATCLGALIGVTVMALMCLMLGGLLIAVNGLCDVCGALLARRKIR